MIKVKNVKMKNFCGYRDMEFNFYNNEKINPISVFFGPNGTGKTTVIKALNILANPHRLSGRDNDLIFRKLTYNQDFDSTYSILKQMKGLEKKNNLFIHALFQTESGDKNVVIENGIVKENELEREQCDRIYEIDADNPMNMNKFQLISGDNFSDMFEEMAKVIYGFDVYFDKEISAPGQKFGYFTDLVLVKDEDNCHFKQFSRGEKKVAGLLRSLCDSESYNKYSIYMIDNLELHIFFKRHPKVIDMLTKYFPDKQFICTSHSQTMIDYVGKTFGQECLYDLEIYKAKEKEKIKKEKEGSLLNAINLLKK
jgi:predicted ATP-binding protein involved in virulence